MEIVRHACMPSTYRIYATSDWHVGARACHMHELQRMIQRIYEDDAGYWVHGGDWIEGKPVKSKHFNPDSLEPNLITVKQQMRRVKELVEPIAHKCLAVVLGNHDMYLRPDVDVQDDLCREMGLPRGDYQTLLQTGRLLGLWYHGRKNLSSNAKDPVQEWANEVAKLVKILDDIKQVSVKYAALSHVHKLHKLDPIEEYCIVMMEDGSLHARHVVRPVGVAVDPKTGMTYEVVPKESRHYFVTGTFRRSGGLGYTDYGEVAGFKPSPIGYQIVHVEDDEVARVETVIP